MAILLLFSSFSSKVQFGIGSARLGSLLLARCWIGSRSIGLHLPFFSSSFFFYRSNDERLPRLCSVHAPIIHYPLSKREKSNNCSNCISSHKATGNTSIEMKFFILFFIFLKKFNCSVLYSMKRPQIAFLSLSSSSSSFSLRNNSGFVIRFYDRAQRANLIIFFSFFLSFWVVSFFLFWWIIVFERVLTGKGRRGRRGRRR